MAMWSGVLRGDTSHKPLQEMHNGGCLVHEGFGYPVSFFTSEECGADTGALEVLETLLRGQAEPLEVALSHVGDRACFSAPALQDPSPQPPLLCSSPGEKASPPSLLGTVTAVRVGRRFVT